MGIFITVYALVEIAGFVVGRKDGVEVSEAVIVNEKIETKDEEVKLLK